LAHQMYPQRAKYFWKPTLQPLLNPTATWWSIWNKRHRTYWD
jgi:hypothetical protein